MVRNPKQLTKYEGDRRDTKIEKDEDRKTAPRASPSDFFMIFVDHS
jgi:hypothetical protein